MIAGSRRHLRVPVRIGVLLLTIGLLSVAALQADTDSPDSIRVTRALLSSLPAQPVSWRDEVRPLLERRCIVCHGCYDAPCQLKLSSMEGLLRGASKQRVYDGTRITDAPPTRLFIDARTTEEWRRKGFHPVLAEGAQRPVGRLQESVLYQMLLLKRINPQPTAGRLPATFDLGLDRNQVCPKRSGFAEFAQDHPLWGMPYALPGLTEAEFRTLAHWIAQGAPGMHSDRPSEAARPRIRAWEAFLNGDSLKQRLVSRYLFEHLFQADLHFEGTGPREFYRLVRSATPPGTPVDELVTVRPFDDPGRAAFFYRFERRPASVVAKSHVVYRLSPGRMARLRELFLAPDYQVSRLPPYATAAPYNPFLVFEAIPPRSRYRFLLDDARFFVEGFIKGPVCRGQIALSVIEDQFWVFFFDPDRDLFTLQPAFLRANAEYLSLPADGDVAVHLKRIWTDNWVQQKAYIAAKEAYFHRINRVDLKDALSYIWDGDGTNPDAALTVFRHFDSASVRSGLAGDYPETAWIIDFPLFERIHYLLVAGFNVWGNVGHQLHTRLYMDFLRMEGEDHFLAFLPAEKRKSIRDKWYQGLRAGIDRLLDAPMDWLGVESVIGYRTDDPQHEFYRLLEQRLQPVLAGPDRLNRCRGDSCLSATTEGDARRLETAMRRVAAVRGLGLDSMPDLVFMRVRSPAGDKAYALIHNKAYHNIIVLSEDEDRRDRQNDSMTVLAGLEGAYPNFFFDVHIDDVDDFADRFASVRDLRSYRRLIDRYGVRRTDPAFWLLADWFQDYDAQRRPLSSGIYDLNRYHNH